MVVAVNALFQRALPTRPSNAPFRRALQTRPTDAPYRRALPTRPSNERALKKRTPTRPTNPLYKRALQTSSGMAGRRFPRAAVKAALRAHQPSKRVGRKTDIVVSAIAAPHTLRLLSH